MGAEEMNGKGQSGQRVDAVGRIVDRQDVYSAPPPSTWTGLPPRT